MRAIIETGGKQFHVAPDDTIRVPSLRGEPGESVTFDRVLYAAKDGDVRFGTPRVEGAQVTAEIVKHGRGKKIIVFKFKRRKRYRRKQGHRQNFTELRITDVSVVAGTSKARAKATDAESEGAFACPDCGREFETERGMKLHHSRSHK